VVQLEVPHLKGRIVRLDRLDRGLAKEVVLSKGSNEPQLFAERRVYLTAEVAGALFRTAPGGALEGKFVATIPSGGKAQPLQTQPRPQGAFIWESSASPETLQCQPPLPSPKGKPIVGKRPLRRLSGRSPVGPTRSVPPSIRRE
jgi:hypothetical protein